MSRRFLVLATCLLWSSPAPGATGPSEYQVKAAFLYKFARFVEWPDSSFASPEAPLVIGILGDDPFGPMLDQAVAGKRVQGRQLQVLRFSHLDQAPPCHILFVGRLQQSGLSPVLDLAEGQPVLSVGEAEGFNRAGGIIRLLVEGQQVFFEINAGAAQRAGLKLSSQLLKLARNRDEAP